MPPVEDSVGAESSTAAPQDSATAASSTAPEAGGEGSGQDRTAESSTAQAEPTSALEAMERAAAVMQAAQAARAGDKGHDKGGDSPAQGASGEDGTKPQGEGDGKDGGEKGAAAAEGEEKVHPKTAQRIADLTAKLKDAEPKVKNWEALQQFVDSAGFRGPEQFAQYLEIGRLMNHDPLKAIPIIEQTLAALKQRVGLDGSLPEDIQKRLDEGLIDEATARELAEARARQTYQETLTEEQRQQQQLAAERAQEVQRVQTIGQAIAAAEKDWESRDPDYGKLQPLVGDKVLVLLQQKGHMVRTPEDAKALFNEAIQAVKDRAKSLVGQRQEIRPVQGGGGGRNAAPEPKSSLEAMELAYQAGRNGR